MKISVVSPTFNEAANISRLISEVAAALEDFDFEIVIADDNSPDGTWKEVEKIARSNTRVRVIRRLKNRGLSPAVVEGFLAASGDYVACIDADLQHDPGILPQMIAALDSGSEVAVGSRYVSGGGTGEWDLIRRFQSWVATRLAQLFLGVALRDPMSGFFILRREDFRKVCTQLDVRGFKILLEIVACLAPTNLTEIPYTFRTRVAGESKLSSKVILEYLGQLWRLSSISRYMSVRFMKFALVGTSGVFINLCIFIALSRILGIQDWRISAAASFLSNLTNYIANNAWTFVDRGHRGWAMARGYLSYLFMSFVGLSASTLTFAALSHGLHRHFSQQLTGNYLKPIILGFQLVSILVGTFFNYELNRRVTWRDMVNRKVKKEHSLDEDSVSHLETAQDQKGST
jgi:dolichol-phosphate mannosyltransferase